LIKVVQEEDGEERLFGPVRDDVRGGWKKIAYRGLKYARHRITLG
jgi:hypothetical protein